jgi:hypothetical protein
MPTKLRHPEDLVEAPSASPRIGAMGAVLLTGDGALGAALGLLGLADILAAPLDGLPLVILGAALVLAGVQFRNASAGAAIPFAPGVRGRLAGFLAEIVLGIVAVLLGILALAKVGSLNIPAFGAIALGLGLWMGSADLEEFDRAVPRSSTRIRKPFDESAGVDVLFGILAVALGILAWIGVAPRALPLVADIGVGAALIIIGLVLARRATARN